MTTTCSRCGTPVLPNDENICPVCRRSVDPLATSELITDDITDVAKPEAAPLQELIQAASQFETPDQLLFREACTILRGPEPSGGRSSLLLFLSLGAFLVAGKFQRPIVELAIVVGVLFLHESGHWLGMRFFGYQNVKMFFLPFFGAAVTGRKEGVPQWQEAVVLLLGPIPGLALGFGLYVWHVVSPQPLVAQIARWLIGINAFNLLPFEPLDGGRFLNLVIFSRNHILESIFLSVTSLVVTLLSLWSHQWIFVGLGLLGLIMVPARNRAARAAIAVRERWPMLPRRIADAPDDALRDVFTELRKRSSARMTAPVCAGSMRGVYERALVTPVPVLGSLALLAVYASGIATFWLWVIVVILENVGKV
jgi:Zn-dependent protease